MKTFDVGHVFMHFLSFSEQKFDRAHAHAYGRVPMLAIVMVGTGMRMVMCLPAHVLLLMPLMHGPA